MSHPALFPVFQPPDVAFSHGQGATLHGTDGKTYIDFLAGIATCSLGHAHPAMVKALSQQVGRYSHVSNLFRIPEQEDAAAALVRTAGPPLARTFFSNSGAEANEAAIKLARKTAWRRDGENAPFEILSTHAGFHGRTFAALAATGTPRYQEGFGPMPEGFVQVPFDDLDAARAAMSERTCAVLVEPVQGEGGVNPASPGYLEGLQELCREHGALFILDEVQTGLGRLGGSMFAFQKYGLSPDILVLAKGLGSGFPVGAILATEDVAANFKPGDHGSTYGGNPMAAQAVSTVLEVIENEGLLQRAEQAGAFLRRELEGLLGHSVVISVRGEGLLLAVELSVPAVPVAKRCLENGLLINAVRPNALRIVPPLVITDAEMEAGLDILRRALAEALAA